jgi:hypothetical protein
MIGLHEDFMVALLKILLQPLEGPFFDDCVPVEVNNRQECFFNDLEVSMSFKLLPDED